MKESSRDLFTKVDDFLTEKLKGYDELKNVVTHGLPSHLANDLVKLRKERDKVLQRLGEQTFQLLSQGKLIVPGIVQATYRTAQEIIERISRIEMDSEASQPPPPAPEPAKEKAPVEKAPASKAAPRPPVKAAKPAAKKPAAKKPAPRKPAKKPAPKKAAAKKPAKKPAPAKSAGGKSKKVAKGKK